MLVAAAAVSTALVPAAGAGPARDVCAAAGVTRTSVVRIYGPAARPSPLPLIGNGPKQLTNVPACFIEAGGGIVVATVQRYAGREWASLAAIYRSEHVPRAPLGGLGAGASLYTVRARPGSYEQDLLFRGGSSVVVVRSGVLASPSPPRAAAPKLTRLARAIRAQLDRPPTAEAG